MSPGRRRSEAKPRRRRTATVRERLILDPAERKAALLGVIGAAKRRVILSLFRCDDFSVLDALAAALERGCEVEAVLTKRAKGGKKRLKKLWSALEEMGAVVTRFADPVVKYHAKYLVADDATAIITTLNPTQEMFHPHLGRGAAHARSRGGQGTADALQSRRRRACRCRRDGRCRGG